MQHFFSSREVMELCDSIKGVHQALMVLGAYFGNNDDTESSSGNALQNDFMRWGLMKISESFLAAQYRDIEKILAFYREVEKKLGVKKS